MADHFNMLSTSFEEDKEKASVDRASVQVAEGRDVHEDDHFGSNSSVHRRLGKFSGVFCLTYVDIVDRVLPCQSLCHWWDDRNRHLRIQ